MTSNRARLVRALARVRRQRVLVRVTRRQRGADQIDGYVVAVGRRWVLLVTPDNAHPDGWTAIRLGDVRRIRDAPGTRLVKHGLKLEGAWPPTAPPFPVDLKTTTGLMDTVNADASAVRIHTEAIDPAFAYVGHVESHHRSTVWLRLIDPDGRWDGTIPFRHREISRLGFGDRYTATLTRVAGPQPT